MESKKKIYRIRLYNPLEKTYPVAAYSVYAKNRMIAIYKAMCLLDFDNMDVFGTEIPRNLKAYGEHVKEAERWEKTFRYKKKGGIDNGKLN